MRTLERPAAAIRGTTGRRRPGPDWIFAVKVVVATRAAFFVIAYAASWYLESRLGLPVDGFSEQWSRWDAGILLRIAEHGYTQAADPHATAFFPLFPLLVSAVRVVVRDAVAAGLIVSTAATTVALAYLYRLAEFELGEGAGRRAALYLALFPTAVFLVAPYTEALFLAGAVPAFYYARRAEWTRVGLPAAVAMGARFAGVFLIFGLAVEFVAQGRFDAARVARGLASLGIALVPLVAYSLFMWAARGDPFYFATDQRLGWARELTNPITAFDRTWDTWEGGYAPNWIFAWRIEIVAALAGVGFVIWAALRRWWGYAAFMGSLLALLVSSTWYFSIPRMLLSMFPIALLLATATARRPERHELLIGVLAPLAALGVIVFTRGAWFY